VVVEPIPLEDVFVEEEPFNYGKTTVDRKKLDIMLNELRNRNPTKPHKIRKFAIDCKYRQAWEQVCLHLKRKAGCPECQRLCNHYEIKESCFICGSYLFDLFKDIKYGSSDNETNLEKMLHIAKQKRPDKEHRIRSNGIDCEFKKQWTQLCLHLKPKSGCVKCKLLCPHYESKGMCPICDIAKNNMSEILKDFRYGVDNDTSKLNSMLDYITKKNPDSQ